ncbi:MAG: AAA domain-containing protein [Promethearchaeota archaeon]
MYKFANHQDKTITIQNPFICTMEELLDYKSNNKMAMCLLADDSGAKIVGFLYNKFAELLSDRHVQNRLPFKVSVIAGKISKKGSNLVFEIYQCIFEKDFLINSSSLASHSFCEMSTYLNTHIHADSPYNPAQIFGNIYHDYLMFVFEDEELLTLSLGDPQISIKIKTAFQKAIYRNWQSLAAFNVNEQAYLDYFTEYYRKKEVEFIHYELEKLRNFGDDYKFQAEVMARSSFYGLQGRVDRILWNRTNNSFTLYETKTGRSSFSAENTAKFQLMSYSLILTEYYAKELEELLLEYPRSDLDKRLKLIEFDEQQIIRLITMRNEIWAISIGRRPFEGQFKGCSPKCFQKDACSFYCLRSYLTKNCLNCERCNYHSILFDEKEFEEFRRVNVYYDWFYQFLEMEYLNNQDLLSELGLPANERESLGNCFADVQISSIDRSLNEKNEGSVASGKFWITFVRKPSTSGADSFTNTRMNTSDYVLITPQNYRPLTLQSIPATVYEIQDSFLILEVSSDYFPSVSDFASIEKFRIDIMTSNRIVKTKKTALDSFLRMPYLLGNATLKQIRSYLINLNPISKDSASLAPVNEKIADELRKKHFNPNQIEAILRSLVFSDLFLIQGPPGTGKTTVISEIVNQLVQKLKPTPNFELHDKFSEVKKSKSKIEVKEPKIPEFEFEHKLTTKKILLTAFTNRAVDTLVEMLLKKYPEIDVLRLGSKLSISEHVKSCSLDIQAKKEAKLANGDNYEIFSSQKAHDLIKNATVIATTCLGANSVLLQGTEFEYVIIDEAGQVIEPVALIPVLKAKRVILVGDDAQLPPISVKEQNPLLDTEYFADKNYLQGFHGTILQYQGDLSTAESRKDIFLQELNNLGIQPSDTLSVSLFQRLKRKIKDSFQFILLTEQYRMHKSISDFISERFYDGKLVPGKINDVSIGERTIKEFYSKHQLNVLLQESSSYSSEKIFSRAFTTENPMIFLDTMNINATDSKLDEKFDEMASKFNTKEARILGNLVYQIVSLYLKMHPTLNMNSFQEFLMNVGVITPYRSQVRLIRSVLYDLFSNNKELQEIITKNILVDTVDKFQGKESEIIIISLTDSNPSKQLSSLYSELRRFNVSITRAKTKVIIIGNSDMFNSKPLRKSRTIIDFMNQDPKTDVELSNDSSLKGTHLKNDGKINRFFKDLMNYIQNQKGYVILDENMLKGMEK